jgi:hypothetical protein
VYLVMDLDQHSPGGIMKKDADSHLQIDFFAEIGIDNRRLGKAVRAPIERQQQPVSGDCKDNHD